MSSAVDPINPMGTPKQKGSPADSYPINSSTTTPFFPPVCHSTHWDPTRIYARTVPVQQVALPIAFRPYTKVCLEYRTSAPEEAAPAVPDSLVFPGGGESYPPTRYIESIDNESLLRRLDRPLGTCDPLQYTPPTKGDMYVDRMLVPKSAPTSSRFIDELSMPQVLLRTGPYDCREAADKVNWERSPRLFNNTTKQDRYIAPPSVEPPRQNIWDSSLRCQASKMGLVKSQPGLRAWGDGTSTCELR